MKLVVAFAGPITEDRKFGAEVNCALVNALALYQTEEIDAILCVGGAKVVLSYLAGWSSHDEDGNHSEAQAMKGWLIKGVPKNKVFARGESMDTIGNLIIDAFPFILENADSISTLYFISTREHLRRIKLTFKRLLMDELRRSASSEEIDGEQIDGALVVFSAEWPSSNIHFFSSGCELSIMGRIKEFGLYLLTLYDPLGKGWLWTWLRARRKANRLATRR